MTVEQQLKEMIIYKYGNVLEFSKAIDMPNTTLASIISRGIHTANVANIIKICKKLGISVDELANDRITPIDEKELKSPNRIDDIERIARLLAYQNLCVHEMNDHIDDEDRQTIIIANKVAVEMIKRRHTRNRGDSE